MDILRAHETFHTAEVRRQILVADDEGLNREMLGAVLDGDYDLLYAENGIETLELMRRNADTLSLVLLDLMMPGMNGLEILRIKRTEPKIQQIPIIVVTADQKAEVECLTLGAIDFIPKPYPQADVILARVLRTIELIEDKQTILSTERDELTGLYSREYFYRYAVQFDQRHRELDMDAIVLNINRFRLLNERFGTTYGDEVLRRIGARLKGLARAAEGIACRREADTFMLYCPHGGDYQALLEDVSAGLDGEQGQNARVRLRMGVYEKTDKGIEIARRFDRAKSAADNMRGEFMGGIGYYDSALHEKELFNEQLIEDFHSALRERQFEVWYQPKFDIRGEVPVLASAEGLVRWRHPKLGLVSPGVFIPLFEANGLIETLDHYVWREAARQLREWKDTLGFSLPVSVNVSRIDILNPNLIEAFRGFLRDFDLSPSELLLEITESAYTQDSGQIIQTVSRLRELGFQVEMDDFGTGYSSLSMISTMPIDALKLDMSFIRAAFQHGRDTRMLEVIIEIADYLAVPVIAEGVETVEQLNALKTMGCDLAQGYYFSRPVPAGEYERFLLEARDMPPALRTPRQKKARGSRRSFGKASCAPSGGCEEPKTEQSGFTPDFTGLARAISRDIESIYYVDLENDSYLEYRSDGAYGLLVVESAGEDFFNACQRNIQISVYSEDWEKVASAMDKENLLKVLRARESFSMDYRLLKNGRPLYYRLKIMPAEVSGTFRHLIVGVSNVDAQISAEQREAAERQNLQSFARIAQDYFIIYYVDVETDYFIEYSAAGKFLEYGIEKRGEDFFALSRRNMARFVYADDLPAFREIFTKENILHELETHGSLSHTYRMGIEGQFKYVMMKATRLDARHIVIGTSDVDAQIRREQAQASALKRATELADRDALTGVKSKRLFVEAELEWDERIMSGDTSPFAVAFFDLNGLKTINDTRGHAVGDDYIRSACAHICSAFAHSPVYRVGGDEFAAILTGGDYENRAALKERFRAENSARHFPDEAVTACGMSDYIPGEDSRFQDVLERADVDMYEDKKRLKN